MRKSIVLIATALIILSGCLSANQPTQTSNSVENEQRSGEASYPSGSTANKTSTSPSKANTTKPVNNTTSVEDVYARDSHKFALFISTGYTTCGTGIPSNAPLGDGLFYLSLTFADYFVNNCSFNPNNILQLSDFNLYHSGKDYEPKYKSQYFDVHKCRSSTLAEVKLAINELIEKANKYSDSEVFIYIVDHGSNGLLDGDAERTFDSCIILYDNVLWDYELTEMLAPLKSTKCCVIIDSCNAGGFANKLIFGLENPMSDGCSRKDWIVITASSWATFSYLFTNDDPKQGPYGAQLLWYMYDGFVTGNADGWGKHIVPGHGAANEHSVDGVVSIEESFYYQMGFYQRPGDGGTAYLPPPSEESQPQINDQYSGEFFL